ARLVRGDVARPGALRGLLVQALQVAGAGVDLEGDDAAVLAALDVTDLADGVEVRAGRVDRDERGAVGLPGQLRRGQLAGRLGEGAGVDALAGLAGVGADVDADLVDLRVLLGGGRRGQRGGDGEGGDEAGEHARFSAVGSGVKR